LGNPHKVVALVLSTNSMRQLGWPAPGEVLQPTQKGGGERISLSDSPLTFENFSWDTIQKDSRGARIEDVCDPNNPPFKEAKVSQHFQDRLVLNCVKSFLEVQFQDDGLLFGLLTLMDIFKTPS
jgi:hypothetical protein